VIRRSLLIIGLLVVAAGVSGTSPGRAATPRWTETVVVRGQFGPGPEQFGRSGIEMSKKTLRLVTCFAANPRHIAVHDRVKKDVKVFAPTGAFEGAFPLILMGSSRPDTVRARDIALDADVLYVLVDENEGGKAIPATMRVATFDVETGACTGVTVIETARLAQAGTPTARGADAFVLQTNGPRLWIYDTLRQLSFEVVSAGPSHLSERPVFGWGGTTRVRTDDNASTINLLDAEGKMTRRIPQAGVLVAVSEDGDAFAVLQTAGGADWVVAVFSAEGDPIGTAPRPNRSWKPFKAPVMERKYEVVETPAGAELYELYAGAEGVRVVRWGR
jgi:hypothetical protein